MCFLRESSGRITAKENPHTPSDRTLSQGAGHFSSEASVSSSVLVLLINLPGKAMETPRNQSIGKSCISCGEPQAVPVWPAGGNPGCPSLAGHTERRQCSGVLLQTWIGLSTD